MRVSMKTQKYAEDFSIQEENSVQEITEKKEIPEGELKIRIMGMPSLIEAFLILLNKREQLGELEVKPFSKELNIKTSDFFKRKLGTVVMNTELFEENTDTEEE